MMSVATWLCAGALAVTSLVACGSSSSSSSSGTTTSSGSGSVAATVVLKSIAFNPQTVHIHVGDSVKWVWEDSPVPHNVTFASFAGPTQDSGTFTHTFKSAGTFTYTCTIHTQMTGTVVVS